jgi:hypothetical protein
MALDGAYLLKSPITAHHPTNIIQHVVKQSMAFV